MRFFIVEILARLVGLGIAFGLFILAMNWWVGSCAERIGRT